MKNEDYVRRIVTVVLGALFLTASVSFAAELDEIKQRIIDKGAKWKADNTSMHKLDANQRKMRTGLVAPSKTVASIALPETSNLLSAPSGSLDWRNHGGTNYVTPIKDQGACGSCWAFAATAALESYSLINKTYDTAKNLSEQTLISCSGVGSCNGGFPMGAARYL